MRTVSIEEAQAGLPELVDRAARGEPFVITRAGDPLVQVSPLTPPAERRPIRRGFMPGIKVPEDFDTMMEDEIAEMFGTKD